MGTARRDGWLLRDGVVLASVEVATTRSERRRGLVGRDSLDGALHLQVRWVHTFGVHFDIDVAYLDRDDHVVRTDRLAPNRLGRPCWRARSVVEAPADSLRRWGVAPGDRLEIR